MNENLRKANIHAILSTMHFSFANSSAGLSELEKAIALNNKDLSLYITKAELLLKFNKLDEAKEVIEYIKDACNPQVYAYLNSCYFYKIENYDECINLCAIGLSSDKYDSSNLQIESKLIYLNLSSLFFKNRTIECSKDDYKQLIKKIRYCVKRVSDKNIYDFFPQMKFYINYLLGQSYYNLQKFTRSKKYFKKLLNKDISTTAIRNTEIQQLISVCNKKTASTNSKKILIVLICFLFSLLYLFINHFDFSDVSHDETETPINEELMDIPKEVRLLKLDENTMVGNLREGPGFDYEVVTVIYDGDVYEILNEADDGERLWYEIKTSDDIFGWISSKIVEVFTEEDTKNRGALPHTPQGLRP